MRRAAVRFLRSTVCATGAVVAGLFCDVGIAQEQSQTQTQSQFPAPTQSLEFESPDQEFHALASDQEILAHFHFRNAGLGVLHVLRTASSCGCTAARLDTSVLQPGEQGELLAAFTIGNRTGSQDARITVYPDVGPTVTLHMHIDLPAMPTPATSFVSWQRGEAAQARTVIISGSKDDGYQLLAATSSNGMITPSLIPDGAGRWKLVLTPTSTERPTTAMIAVQTNTPHQVYVFASIQDATPHPAGLTAGQGSR